MLLSAEDRLLFWAPRLAVVLLTIGLTTALVRLRDPGDREHEINEVESEEGDKELSFSQKIPLHALDTLIAHPEPTIRLAALNLANKRLGDTRIYKALLTLVQHDLDSPDEIVKRRARQALDYMNDHVSMTYMPPSPMSYASTTSPPEEWRESMRDEIAASNAESRARGYPQARARRSETDSARRRQRREAMLFHEGSGELGEDDIIELNAAVAEIFNTLESL